MLILINDEVPFASCLSGSFHHERKSEMIDGLFEGFLLII